MACSRSRKNLRRRLSEAQNHRCCYCGVRFGEGFDALTLEHYSARMFGGPTNFHNCVAACKWCNHARGTDNPQKFWFRLNRGDYGRHIASTRRGSESFGVILSRALTEGK